MVGCGGGRARLLGKIGSGTGANRHRSGRQSSNILLKGRFEISVAANVGLFPGAFRTSISFQLLL